MKQHISKSLVLLLASAVPALAIADSSVTLYGKVHAAYVKDGRFDDTSIVQSSTKNSGGFGPGGESRWGIKGSEDLGNGMGAFFQLEGKLNSDVGSIEGDLFDEKAVVGVSVSNGMHKLYLGRSASPIDRIGYSTDHISSGLGWKSSAGQYKNGMYYDFALKGLTLMSAVTTKNGAPGNTDEGNKDGDPSWGVSAKYDGKVSDQLGYSVAAGYQRDNGVPSDFNNEWGVGTKLTFGPAYLALSYADAKGKDSTYSTTAPTTLTAQFDDVKRMHSTLGYFITPNDHLFVNYLKSDATTHDSGIDSLEYQHIGAGYIHSLSKRTEIFANYGHKKGTDYVDAKGARVATPVEDSWNAYDVGIRHSF